MLGFVLGLALLAFTWVSVVFALVVPRTRLGPNRLAIIVNRTVRLVFIRVSRLTQSYERKDAILAPLAPGGRPHPAGGRGSSSSASRSCSCS